MTDGEIRARDISELRSTDIAWALIAVLVVSVLATTAAYSVGVALPYYKNGMDELSADEVAAGMYGDRNLWPQNFWSGPMGQLGVVAVALGPFVFLTALPVAVGCLAVLALCPAPQRLAKSLCLIAVAVVSAAALVFLLWGSGRTMSGWFLD